MAKFTLEKIDAENVKKTDSRPDVTVLNIPALKKEKADVEVMIAKLQTQLDQINEVLVEYEKLP
jgi:Tfp pilus assembly protein PilO